MSIAGLMSGRTDAAETVIDMLQRGVANQGFDSVTVDLQHGTIGFETVIAIFQSILTTDPVPLSRVPRNDLAQVMRRLDAGAYGVICPMISTVDEAWSFARACRYPSRGVRSFGPSHGLFYGGTDYFAKADDQILVIPMIETKEAVENIDAIIAIEEVDMIYVGPNDMALAYGKRPGAEADAPRATEAIAHVLKRPHAAAKPAGIFVQMARSRGNAAIRGLIS